MSDSQKLTPPPGYRSVVIFDKEKHKGLAVKPAVPFGARLNAIFVTATEFALASRDYPLIFIKEPATTEFVPMALTGLASNQNLFVDNQGQWAKHVYVPAYVRRYPFCVAQGKQTDGSTQAVICVDETALESSDTPLFDNQARATSAWQKIDKFISDMEAARLQTERLTRALDDLDLLESFEAQAVLNDGGQFHLTSMYRVSEKKLNVLPGDVLQELMKQGSMGQIYMHIASLNNFRRLVDRTANGTPTNPEKENPLN